MHVWGSKNIRSFFIRKISFSVSLFINIIISNRWDFFLNFVSERISDILYYDSEVGREYKLMNMLRTNTIKTKCVPYK